MRNDSFQLFLELGERCSRAAKARIAKTGISDA
jgi:hypothetical protein